LPFGKFLDGPDEPNAKSLARLSVLLKLAEKEGLYVNLTGPGCSLRSCWSGNEAEPGGEEGGR
jgi:hypothetical protein